MSRLEKLCLRNDFQETILSCCKEFRQDREFTDVTLACEDDQQVDAHKIVSASLNQFFKNLLSLNKHQHPLIYMRG